MRMRSVLSTFELLAILVFCCATLVFAARSTRPSTKTFASTGRSSSRGSSTGRSSSRGQSSSGRSEEVDVFLTGKGSSGTGRKGKSSGDALQLAELLKTILETFEKFEPAGLVDTVDKGEWKNGIIIFSEGKFWKQLFKNGNNKQLMTLKEFHQKYESTLTAEFLFLDLKRWFKMHSNWEGKGKTDEKTEEELVKMLQDMYNHFFMPWNDDSNKIANVFGLNKDEIVLRVLDTDNKPQYIQLVFVEVAKKVYGGKEAFGAHLSDTNTRRNKFTFNNYDTSMYRPEELTVADMMSMEHPLLLELFVCEPKAAEAKSMGDCDSYLVNLEDERNKKLLGAKKGRFVVKPKMSKEEADRTPHWGIEAYIEVDNNPWEE